MNTTYIVISSITNAARGKNLLEGYGIKAKIIRNTRLQARYGCGYALVITRNADEAQALLVENGIRILAVMNE